MYSLSDLSLPILEVNDLGILSKTGDFTVCFQVTKPSLYSLSAAQHEAIHQSWVKALRTLPFGTILHMQDMFFESEDESQVQMGRDSMLAEASDEHFIRRVRWNHVSYCYLTRRAPGRKPSSSALSTLLKGNLVPESVLRPDDVKTFVDQCEQFRAILKDSGFIQLRRLSAEELIGKDGCHGVLEQYLYCRPCECDTCGDIAFEEDIRIHDRACAIYTLADAELLPEQCSPYSRYEPYSTSATLFPIGFTTGLGPLLDAYHIYNQYIFLDDPAKTLAVMEARRRRLKNLSGNSRENAVSSEAIAKFLQEAAEGNRMPVKAHFNVIAWDYDPDEIKNLKRKLTAAITRMGAIPHLETVGAPQIWWAGIPGNAGDFPMNDTFDTFLEQAACFLLPEMNIWTPSGLFGIRLGDRHRGLPLHVDISDEPLHKKHIGNRNKFVLGGSGSGKSFFINLLVRMYVEQGAHIVLVDVGGSYSGLCQLLEGVYYSYTEEEPIRFNPFRLELGDRPDTEKKENIKTLLLALWKQSDEAFLRSEYVALSNAIHDYYDYLVANPTIPACFNSWYEFIRDVYAPELAKEKVKVTDFDIDNFLYVLRPYYKGGEYDYLLNAMDQPNLLEERLIIFELDNIKDHPILFPVVTIIIMEVFLSKIRNLNGIRKAIIIEEAWKAIAREGMGEYIKYLFRTVRKFFGEAIVVTQDIEDIVSSPIVKNTIINNADCKILLDQSKFLHRFDQVQQLLGLSDSDKVMVLSLNKSNDPKHKYKEVFIGLANGPSNVYRVEVSLEEYLVYTTEQKEKKLVQKYTKQHGGDMEDGIIALAKAIRSGAVKFLLAMVLCGLFLLIPQGKANAQVLDIIGLAEAVAKKVIVAADIKVQQLQTETIALQDAEKALENSMAGGLLDDITGWVQQQENLYGEYYEELWKVKSALSTYSKVAELIQRQTQLVKDEQQAWGTVQHDPHFSTAELNQIGSIYGSIIDESSRNIQQIALVINSFVTQMDDAGRLAIIDETSKGIDHNYLDLQGFTQENTLLSLQRAKDENDLLTIKALYNL